MANFLSCLFGSEQLPNDFTQIAGFLSCLFGSELLRNRNIVAR